MRPCAVLVCLALLACRSSDERSRPAEAPELSESPEPQPPDNVLLLIVDEMGTDKIGAWGAENAPPTPTLDALADRGVRFDDTWVTPVCSTTRAAILTGRYPRRTGFGENVLPGSGLWLDTDEVSIAQVVAQAPVPWATEAIGKWHLADFGTPFELDHALAMGFDHHHGSVENLDHASVAEPTDYFHWERVADGQPALVDDYATTRTIDDALSRLDELPEPWLMWVGLHAAHFPWHVPPAHLHTSDITDASSTPDKCDAMIEALDTEIGRLLASMDPEVLARTTVVVIGDNGTPEVAISPPHDPKRHKGTMYEGGVRVPLIIAGPWVEAPGARSSALVHGVDLFATIADLAGVDPDEVLPPGRDIDGHSLLPWLSDPDAPSERQVLLSEKFSPNRYDDRTIRDERYKLIERLDEPDEFFDLATPGLDEGPDLLPAGLTRIEQEAYDRLKADLSDLVAALEAAP